MEKRSPGQAAGDSVLSLCRMSFPGHNSMTFYSYTTVLLPPNLFTQTVSHLEKEICLKRTIGERDRY